MACGEHMHGVHVAGVELWMPYIWVPIADSFLHLVLVSMHELVFVL